MEETTENKVSWNLSESLIKEIGALLQQASAYYADRYFGKCFDCLVSVKNRAIQSFSEEERTAFTAAEAELVLYLKAYNHQELMQVNPQLWNKTNNLAYKKLNKYNAMLMDGLNKYGYLIKLQEDRTRLQA